MAKYNRDAFNWLFCMIKQFLQIAIMALIVALVLINWKSVNYFVERFLYNAEEVSIANVLSVSIAKKDGVTHREEWAAYYRVADRVRILEAYFDDSGTQVEYIELIATAPVNLSGSFIGDKKRVLFLGNEDIHLDTEEIIRIYTFDGRNLAPEKSPVTARQKYGRKVVYAKPLGNCKLKKGIFKADPGEGDRIVMINRDKKVILDLDYWWVQPPINNKL